MLPLSDLIFRFYTYMARKKKAKKTFEFDHGLAQETIYSILAVFFFVLGVVFILASLSLAGPVGEATFTWLSKVLGVGYFLLPALFFVLSIAFAKVIHQNFFGTLKGISAFVFLISGLGFIELVMPLRGGLVGSWIAHPLVNLFDVYVSALVLIGFFLVSVLIMFDTHLTRDTFLFWRRWRREKDLEELEEDTYVEEVYAEEPEEEDIEDDVEEPEEEAYEEDEGEDETEENIFDKARDMIGGLGTTSRTYLGEPYTAPPLKLLGKDKGKPSAGDVKANANIIKRTLANFGITVEIEEVTVGPSVTRYAMKPAEGVRLSKILGLQNNLELALAAHPLRIEAPIPGRSLVGIEIPNSAKTMVSLGTLLASDVVKSSDTPLFFPLGRNVDGTAHGMNLAKLPHLLVAGTTGSGKSVTIHTLITSFLYRNGPQQLKFVMVDPKRVELTLYNGIPHLLTPVITEPKKAILALKWLIGEMERRYDVLQDHKVRDVMSYHSTILEPALAKLNKQKDTEEEQDVPEPMPYIVVIIDELADLMSSYPRELEASIVRLAQMSRAVGIHLVLSTQRPSVNVITGLIKANVPGRVALQVASQVDSRTILDARGAEQLLGSGDMLFMSTDMAKPLRLQGAYVSESEVKKVVKHLTKHYDVEEELDFTDDSAGSQNGMFDDMDDEDGDDLYEDAREAVIAAGKGSTSYLQRKLRVGYARAARLMDMLEERGIVGPAEGSKPREILVDAPDEEYDDEEE